MKLRRAIVAFAALLAFPTILVMAGCSGTAVTPGTAPDHDTSSSFASIAANPVSGKAPLLVSFRAVDLGHAMFGIVTKDSWDFGDGTKSEGFTAEHTFTKKGEYAVALTIFYQDGTQQVARKTIEVK